MNRVAGKIGSVSLLATSTLFTVPGLAFAEEAEKSGVDLLIPSMAEFIPMVIAFIIMWVILAKFGYPMIEGMLDKRAKKIKDDLDAAEQAKIEGQRLLEEYRAQMEDAKKQASDIIADAKKTGETVRADLTTQAQAESEKMIEKARSAIEAEKKAAVADLQSSVADISVSVAGKVIGQDLSDDEHRRIIEKYVEQAGSLNAD
mgnify:CR=1 FL=1